MKVSWSRRVVQPTSVVILVAALVPVHPARAEYVASKDIITGSDLVEPLLKEVAEEFEKGIGSLAEELLTSLGKELLGALSPTIASLLFDDDGGAEAQTRQILDALKLSYERLDENHRVLLDELLNQYAVDLESELQTASSQFDLWLAEPDLQRRLGALNFLLSAAQTLESVRQRIQEYVLSEGSTTVQYRRLPLLSMHILATQLSAVANRQYFGMVSIKTAFERVHGTDYRRFDEWLMGLTEDDLRRISVESASFRLARSRTYNEAVDFYERLATADPIADYIDERFTPTVGLMTTFSRPLYLYDVPEHITDPAAWTFEQDTDPDAEDILNRTHMPRPRLDGQRWYYYFDVPDPECLRDFAFPALEYTTTVPWREVEDGTGAASECNRFWFLDPALEPTPQGVLASFLDYDVWFTEASTATTLHRRMLHSEIILATYGPISLILDRMYQELYGQRRPRNAWDERLSRFDEEVAILAVPESMLDGIYYWQLARAAAELRRAGVRANSVGMAQWLELHAQMMQGADCNGDGEANAFDILTVTYYDVDGDGFADTPRQVACLSLDIVPQADCSVDSAGLHRGRAEVCNGIDDNCDGIIDGPDLDCPPYPCLATPSPVDRNSPVTQCVCDVASECCNEGWDTECVEVVEAFGCSQCDCLNPDGGPHAGCDRADVMRDVCDLDASCCEIAWASGCASLAAGPSRGRQLYRSSFGVYEESSGLDCAFAEPGERALAPRPSSFAGLSRMSLRASGAVTQGCVIEEGDLRGTYWWTVDVADSTCPSAGTPAVQCSGAALRYSADHDVTVSDEFGPGDGWSISSDAQVAALTRVVVDSTQAQSAGCELVKHDDETWDLVAHGGADCAMRLATLDDELQGADRRFVTARADRDRFENVVDTEVNENDGLCFVTVFLSEAGRALDRVDGACEIRTNARTGELQLVASVNPDTDSRMTCEAVCVAPVIPEQARKPERSSSCTCTSASGRRSLGPMMVLVVALFAGAAVRRSARRLIFSRAG